VKKTTYLLIALLLAAVAVQACAQPTPEVSPTTPVQVQETEPPEPTATPEPTEAMPTEEPTPEPTEPQPTPTPTPEVEQPTATPEPEEATATPEPTAEPAAPQGQVLLEERCTECHTLSRVENAQKSRQEWATTVDRMIGYGAQISDSERAVLLDYLVETYGP
jgi:outer membrane biosynthesis protein TonB